jgi:anti-anti-sigma factor
VGAQDQFTIDCELRNGRIVVSVRGELDEVTAPELATYLEQQSRREPVLVDLRRLTFISAAGIRGLFNAHNASTGMGLIGTPGSHIRRVLDVVHTEQAMPLYDDLEGALPAS